MPRKRPRQFIPEGDSDFAWMGRIFAQTIAKDREKYFISERDSEMITRRVEEYRKKLSIATSPGGRTKPACLAKSQARARAEQIVRKFGNFIRAHPHIGEADKLALFIKERPTRLKERKCPPSVPELTFVGSIDGVSAAIPIHVLRFRNYDSLRFREPQSYKRAKPAGAARLELFVELIDPDEPVPNWPGELGRPWYLRSFTKNPIHVEFPMPRRPMKVVYWARWADATGGVGPWSKTCVARVEGWHDAGALEDKRPGSRGRSRIVVSLLRRELPIVERSGQRKLLECDAPVVEDVPDALPDAERALPDAA
jgi:hypothetical protein